MVRQMLPPSSSCCWRALGCEVQMSGIEFLDHPESRGHRPDIEGTKSSRLLLILVPILAQHLGHQAHTIAAVAEGIPP